ncbi:hypothetical protein A9Q84_05430 [Halobacteriovorax marinus]|uniref:Flippase-like domain-containing protein n=1 Tax=Halobacteriovorax marinus TaxID=97084 RepID=A0A1Y5FHP6_9BACT|nr:hypothetical protein A9Q84_05430 [Halobacteriovorax marinus]
MMKKTIRKFHILPLLKLLISSLLVLWVYKSGKINYQNIVFGLSNWNLTFLFLLLTFVQLIAGAKRTMNLIQFKSTSTNRLYDIIKICWASSFVCVISPINIFGDIFRVSTLMKLDKDTNSDNSFYASIYSKAFSVLALILISLASCLFIKKDLPGLHFLKIFSISTISFFFLIFLLRKRLIKSYYPLVSKIVERISNPFLQQRIINFLDYNYDFLKDAKQTYLSLFYSLVIQLFNCYSLFLIVRFLTPDNSVDAVELFSIIPIGIFAQTLPISYSGLGVGHVVFEKLLRIYGISVGADVFTIYFALSLVFNTVGLIPFLSILKDPFKSKIKT